MHQFNHQRRDFVGIGFDNVNMYSRVEFLGQDGKIDSVFSKKHNSDIVIIKNPVSLHKILINKPSIKVDDLIFTNKETNFINTDVKYFRVSNFTYFIIRMFKLFTSKVSIKYNFTEFEYIPLGIKIFLHMPILLTVFIVAVIIVTYEPEINAEMIRNEIDKIPDVKYSSEMNCDCFCSICLDNYIEGESLKNLECGHIFHKDCAKSWLMTSLYCPICRHSVSKLTLTHRYELQRSYGFI
ncbi:ZNRF3 [Hepatospora eriocheir]|uniref:ZNRF3 n=1 Tax=Hepatospora eriocheir TaxID=1081669 RepID=A0A1X0QJD9_9MICR|nr:ZNRF3 [Hepatospora eriocheir]